jgi:hypothetical protein
MFLISYYNDLSLLFNSVSVLDFVEHKSQSHSKDYTFIASNFEYCT